MTPTETATFFAVPDEALFIGPPRSQVKGEAHHAASLFPPPPSTFQGAIRTRILLAGGVPLHDRAAIEQRVGTAKAMPSGWQIDGPWIAELFEDEVVPWLATPACIGLGRAGWAVLGTRSAADTSALVMDTGAPRELPAAGIVSAFDEPNPVRWINAHALRALLAGEVTGLLGADEQPFADETRVGLAIDDATRTAVRANLYFRRTVRMGRPTAIAGLYASLTTPQGTGPPPETLATGTLRLGRRGRALALQAAPPPVRDWLDICAGAHLDDLQPEDGALFWLILASPVSFPDEPVTGSPVRPKLPPLGPCTSEVVAAVHLPPVVLGGLDFATHRSKPNRAFLMPGTAWGVRIAGGSPDDRRAALRALHHRCTLGPEEDRPFGFGRTWIALPHMETT